MYLVVWIQNTFLSKKWLNHFGDIWSISLGKSNDHGQNWLKPLLWLIGISTIFFPFLFLLADSSISFTFDFTKEGVYFLGSKVSEHASVWPQLFNPTRRVSDMFKVIEYPFWVYLLDGLQRIILAFFIFQIVSAFRKFVK